MSEILKKNGPALPGPEGYRPLTPEETNSLKDISYRLRYEAERSMRIDAQIKAAKAEIARAEIEKREAERSIAAVQMEAKALNVKLQVEGESDLKIIGSRYFVKLRPKPELIEAPIVEVGGEPVPVVEDSER